jgi:hypothetical protein
MNAARDPDALRARKVTLIINCAQKPELKDVLHDQFQINRLNMVEHPYPVNFDATATFEKGVEAIDSVISNGSFSSISTFAVELIARHHTHKVQERLKYILDGFRRGCVGALRWWNVSISLNRLRIPHCQVRHEER